MFLAHCLSFIDLTLPKNMDLLVHPTITQNVKTLRCQTNESLPSQIKKAPSRYYRLFPCNLSPPFSPNSQQTDSNQHVIKRVLFPFLHFMHWQLLLRDPSWPGVTWVTRPFCRCVSIVKDGLDVVRCPVLLLLLFLYKYLMQIPLEPWESHRFPLRVKEGGSYSVYPQSYKCSAKGLFAHRCNLLLFLWHLKQFYIYMHLRSRGREELFVM